MSFFNELKRRNVVRVGIGYVIVAWLVAQVVELAADSFGAPDWVMKMVITLLALGLPFATFFAWAFELTPEGIKREKDVDRSQSITSQTGRKLDRTIIFIMALALAYFAVDKFWLGANRGPGPTAQSSEQMEAAEKQPETIAVLPFVDMSPEGDNEYFSDGLTEELLNILARIQDLQVAGRTSSFAFKGRNEDLREIGEKLGVNTILEGSVRKDPSGQRVRITAQLVNVENGFHLWSETYDRDLEDIFAIQDEIAHEVAAALRVTLLGEDEQRIAERGVTDLNAYETYLQALQQFNEYSYRGLREAETLFTRSMELDPDYLPARMGLVRTLFELEWTGAMSRSEVIERTSQMLVEILQDDPDNAEARTLYGRTLDWQGDDAGEMRQLEQALTHDPRNTFALEIMGRKVYFQGDTDTGIQYLKEAERLDPYAIRVLYSLCSLHGWRQELREAERYCGRIAELEPENPMAYYGRANAAQATGDLAHAVYWNIKAAEVDPDDHELPAGIATLWLDLGDSQQAENWLQKAEAISPDKTASIAARILLMLSREQHALAGDMARRALSTGLDRRVGTTVAIEGTFMAGAISRGQPAEALAYFETVRPEFFGDIETIPRKNVGGIRELIDIAYLLQLQDPQSSRAQSLLDIVEQRIQASDRKAFPYSYLLLDARLAAVRGQHEQAMGLLEQAVEKGLRNDWRLALQYSPIFATVRTNPRFAALVARIEADMDRQREEAHRLIAERVGP